MRAGTGVPSRGVAPRGRTPRARLTGRGTQGVDWRRTRWTGDQTEPTPAAPTEATGPPPHPRRPTLLGADRPMGPGGRTAWRRSRQPGSQPHQARGSIRAVAQGDIGALIGHPLFDAGRSPPVSYKARLCRGGALWSSPPTWGGRSERRRHRGRPPTYRWRPRAAASGSGSPSPFALQARAHDNKRGPLSGPPHRRRTFDGLKGPVAGLPWGTEDG